MSFISSTGTSSKIKLDGIKRTVHMDPGDLLMLRSDLVAHHVEPWEGERMSFVYFFDRNVFTEKE
jgi:hypothetical protein